MPKPYFHGLDPIDVELAYQSAIQMAARATAGDRAEVMALLSSAEHPSIVAWALARLVGQVGQAVALRAGASIDFEAVLRDLAVAVAAGGDQQVN